MEQDEEDDEEEKKQKDELEGIEQECRCKEGKDGSRTTRRSN